MSNLQHLSKLVAWLEQHGLSNSQQIAEMYFGDMPIDEWQERPIEDWGGALLAHWRFGQCRPEGEALLRIYNPSQAEHGWQCAHTVIEIVHEDMPFLVDSVGMALNALKYNALAVIHPVIPLSRDDKGLVSQLQVGAAKESWMHFELNRISDPALLTTLQQQIEQALSAIAASVADWSKMLGGVEQTLQELRSGELADSASSVKEAAAYLEWLLDGHFVFLGLRKYKFVAGELLLQAGSGLGVLRDHGGSDVVSRIWSSLSQEQRDIAYANNRVVMLTKSDRRSIIHRPAYLDTILVRTLDQTGQLLGETRIVGLYSASAYSTPPRQIPILRQKIEHVVRNSGADLSGYRGKALLNTLETYPRDELIEIEVPELTRIALGIVSLHERSRVRAFFRDDIYQRYVSVMVFVPRDNYSTEVRIKIETLLLEKLAGSSAEYTVLLGEAPLARLHYLIRRPVGVRGAYDASLIEQEIANLAQRWTDGLKRELIHIHGEEKGARLYQKYQSGFSAAYCADFSPRIAVHDIDALEQSQREHFAVSLSAANSLDPTIWRFKLYRQHAIELSDCLPLLENLGLRVLDERPYPVVTSDHESLSIMDIGIRLPPGASLELPAERQRMMDSFIALFNGQAENDSFNRLTLLAGLAWREVLILRAYARFLKQVAFKYGVETIADCLLKYPSYSKQLVNAFSMLHHPDESQEGVAEIVLEEIEQAAKVLPNIDEERILTGFVQSVRATLRTNFFQSQAGLSKPYLALKIASPQLSFMPQPVPMCEIFIYSPQLEGVHLRGGKVARGGLRWSDRREDFRTEVLGLVKAQMVKNTVIVPVGSKGGFIVKNPPLDRDALLPAGMRCYQTFISGLLDLTDNLRDGQITPPTNVRRRDGDDPYLVVAADKGTATFSDIANQIAQEYGFWLDDAFASGGSVGYDHKKMGITARGAWVSVERSFRELGLDTRKEPFSVVGIGDMSGDVFGNGLLRSPCAKLVAAFDHRHIFIDPAPDLAISFAERERLFSLPRSSWADYNPALISKGGGVWPRNAKTIALSTEIKGLLGVEADQLEPSVLIQAILKAPVDLLYNGGIGTYVKASSQSHAEANDRSNDAVRIDGRDLRCRVVAEGGNLGFTQLGRVEYAAQGGRIYTDAIDNSAGVDCSDHEVNIKILLGKLITSGDLTLKQRNEILVSMTEDVGLQVLRDNELQTLAISLEHQQAHSLLSVHTRLMSHLEKAGKLSRRIEYLPDDSALAERQAAGLGLYRPELAVLLAYAKIVLNQDLLAESLIDNPHWDGVLVDYFPSLLRARFPTAIAAHPLRREIIATILTNHIVNRFGLSAVYRLQEETECSASCVVEAFYIAEQLLNSESLAQEVEALDVRVPAEVQIELLLQIRRYTERVARWLLMHPLNAAESDHLHTSAALTLPLAPEWLAASTRHQEQKSLLLNVGVPADLAMKVLLLQEIQPLLEMARYGNDTGQLADRLKLHLALAEQLQLTWLHGAIEQLPRANRWQTLARMAVRDDLAAFQTLLTQQVWQQGQNEQCLQVWLDSNRLTIERILAKFAELRSGTPDLAMISAAVRELRQRLCAA